MRKDIAEIVYMAKKENRKINYAKTARQYNCDQRTVKKHFEEIGKQPRKRKSRTVKKLIEGFETIIEDKYLKYNAPAIEIFEVLRSKYGYKGSYSTIKQYTHDLKEKTIRAVTVRFETNPGLQCQIDWKENLILENCNGEIFTINIFLAILGFSRYKYIVLTLDKTQSTLFRCLTSTFEYFGGVPKELLFDNMRTVVDQARTQFKTVVYNKTFALFAKDAGFIPHSCMAYRPRTKGKVEVVAKLMNRLKAYNREFETFEDLSLIVEQLNEKINSEIHQTTQEKPKDRFLKEKEYLTKEPNYLALYPYFSDQPTVRKVSKEALITYANAKYSVSPKYIGKTVTFKVDKNELKIYCDDKFIESHSLATKKINYKEDHYREILKYSIRDEGKIDEYCKQNLELFDHLA